MTTMYNKVKQIVDIIEGHVEKNGKIPSITKIADELKTNKTTVLNRVQFLHLHSLYIYKNRKIMLNIEDDTNDYY